MMCPETHRPCEEGCGYGPCAIQLATVPHPDSMEGHLAVFRKHWRELWLEVGKALHLDQLLEWLKARLER